LRSRLSRTSPTINRETWSLGTKSRTFGGRSSVWIDIPGAKVLAHSPSLNQTRWHLNSDYSDRLLGELDRPRKVDSPVQRCPANLGGAAVGDCFDRRNHRWVAEIRSVALL
jgi:hypothetical protein